MLLNGQIGMLGKKIMILKTPNKLQARSGCSFITLSLYGTLRVLGLADLHPH